MRDYRLSQQELAELRAAHRATRDVRAAYRINAVILLGKGRSAADVADALLIDPDSVRDYFKRYRIKEVALVFGRSGQVTPVDISVLGFDFIPFASALDPPS